MKHGTREYQEQTLREVAPLLLLNDSFSLRRGEDVYALLSLADLGYISKDTFRSHYESSKDGAAFKWLGQSTDLSKLTIPKLTSLISAMRGCWSSKDKKSCLVSYASRYEGALRYLPAEGIGYGKNFAESRRRARQLEPILQRNAMLLESVVGAEAMDGVLAMVSGEKRFRPRIKFVDQENLLPALVQDTDRNVTKKTCKTVLRWAEKEIAGMPCEEVTNPFYSRGGRMQLYDLTRTLEISMKKHGGCNGLLGARESAELKKVERKRKRQEPQQAKEEARDAILRSESKFFKGHTSFNAYNEEEEDWQLEEANYKGRYIDYEDISHTAYNEARYRALKEWVECHYDTLEHEIRQGYFPPSPREKAQEYFKNHMPSIIMSRERKVMKRDVRQARLAELQDLVNHSFLFEMIAG
eukprot:jgi/Picsp_1/651/NSC_00647-R1_---NA---